MNKIMSLKKVTFSFLFGLIVCFFSACSNESAEFEESAVPVEELSSCKMNFRLNVSPFMTAGQTRAESENLWEWENGATIFIQFHVGASLVRGHAVYEKETNSWDAFYSGDLGESGICEVFYFQNAPTFDKHNITLNNSNPIYSDRSASYTTSSTEITMTATLAPMTSRIKFVGQKGVSISVSGMTTNTSYDADNNSFDTTISSVSRTVAADGNTSYIYGVFADEEKRMFTLSNSIDGDEVLFSKSFPDNVLVVGESGYLSIPTEDTNKGWKVTRPVSEKTFIVTKDDKSVSFTLRRVSKGSFEMGDYFDGYLLPHHHTVNLTKSYFVGETEVTQELWAAVMGSTPTASGKQWNETYGLGDFYPAYFVNIDDVSLFLKALNAETGENFRLPTEAEWEYAAKGGRKSRKSKYSGSNSIDEVAWFFDNTKGLGEDNPNYGTHEVKSKKMNELGLYGMSGNVAEWCSDIYADYQDGTLTNPTGAASGSDNVKRGGAWINSEWGCRPATRESNDKSTRAEYIGFRIALDATSDVYN